MTRSRSAAVATPPPEEDRRVLRLCFAAAVLAHGLLLFLPMPWTGAAAAPDPPPRVVHRLTALRPPEPPAPEPVDPPPPAAPTHVSIPVPEILLDEPPAPDAPLPPPDLDALAEFPVLQPDGPPPPAPSPADDDPIYVIGGVDPPEALFTPEPQYPEVARRGGRPGTVVLKATIDREGSVTDLEVLRSAPLGMTEAALEAVRRWRFRPATVEGRPVAVYYHLTVRFQVR